MRTGGWGLAYLDLKKRLAKCPPPFAESVALIPAQAKVYYHLAPLSNIGNRRARKRRDGRSRSIPNTRRVFALGNLPGRQIGSGSGYYYDQYLKRQPKDQEAATCLFPQSGRSGKKGRSRTPAGQAEDPRAMRSGTDNSWEQQF